MPPTKKNNYKITDNDFVVKSKAQLDFLKTDFDNVQEALLTGPGGTGKTVALLISSLGPQSNGSLLIQNASYVGVIIRREATQLEKSGLINAALEWYNKFDPKVVYNGSLRKFTFSSGAQIWFRGVESEDDALKFKGYTRLHFLGVEELTQFTEKQFDLISTRLRDASGKIPLRIRCTTNAGDTGEDWVLERYKYWLYQSCITPLDPSIKVQYGKRLYTYIDEEDPDLKRVVTDIKPKGSSEQFVCIETKVDDIMKDNLQTLGKISDPVLRAQLLGHKWGLRAEAGMYFSELDFKEAQKTNSSQVVRIRYWDKAATKTGDFTCGLLLCRTWNDYYIIEDCVLEKVDVSKVKDLIMSTARRDGKNVIIGIEQEGGSSGKEIAYEYEQGLRSEGFRVIIDQKTANKETSSKLARAAIISPVVKAGRVGVIYGSWKNEFLKQLVNFPSKGIHDDVVDALTGAYMILTTKVSAPLAVSNSLDMMRIFHQKMDKNMFDSRSMY